MAFHTLSQTRPRQTLFATRLRHSACTVPVAASHTPSVIQLTDAGLERPNQTFQNPLKRSGARAVYRCTAPSRRSSGGRGSAGSPAYRVHL
jgi:hypothetical protein